MLGAIIGDIAGSVYEFSNTKDYNFEMFPSGSNFTDDTVMTMAVAQWALENDINSDVEVQMKQLEKLWWSMRNVFLVLWEGMVEDFVHGFSIRNN